MNFLDSGSKGIAQKQRIKSLNLYHSSPEASSLETGKG